MKEISFDKENWISFVSKGENWRQLASLLDIFSSLKKYPSSEEIWMHNLSSSEEIIKSGLSACASRLNWQICMTNWLISSNYLKDHATQHSLGPSKDIYFIPERKCRGLRFPPTKGWIDSNCSALLDWWPTSAPKMSADKTVVEYGLF